MTLTTAQFDFIRKGLQQRSAILLEDGKEYLVEARLTPLARKSGFENLALFLEDIAKAPREDLWALVVDAMTTNETYFFRDDAPFRALLSTVLPSIIEHNRPHKKLTIWSAASSTGQEAYSLAILLVDNFPEVATWSVTIVGTDISPSVLARARAGTYSTLEVNRGLTEAQRNEHFKLSGQSYQVSERLRSMTRFEKLNLVDDYSSLPRFDLVLIRNVLIYFPTETKTKILDQVSNQLNPGGYLFLGASETTLNVSDRFERLGSDGAIYYRNPAR